MVSGLYRVIRRSDRPPIIGRTVYDVDVPSDPGSAAIFDLTSPALSFSRSRSFSPLMLMVLEWWSRQSRMAERDDRIAEDLPQVPRL